MVCPCRYPILLIKDGILYISFPLDFLEGSDLIEYLDIAFPFEHKGIGFLAFPLEGIEKSKDIPRIYDETHDGKDWKVVQWKPKMHPGVKMYHVVDHEVYAGCEEDKIECDAKSIFETWHPKEEWDKEHILVR